MKQVFQSNRPEPDTYIAGQTCISHAWQQSPLVAYLKTLFDGPNYRYTPVEVCKDCGAMRVDPRWAGFNSFDDATI